MIEYMPYIWMAVVIATVIIESITADIVTIWFIPASIISLVLSLVPLNISVWIQVLIFFVCALILVIMSKTIFKEFFKKKPIVPTNLDAVIGKVALVTETINNIEGNGAVKASGKIWSAVSISDDCIIEKNELVIVKEIVGVKLICEKMPK